MSCLKEIEGFEAADDNSCRIIVNNKHLLRIFYNKEVTLGVQYYLPNIKLEPSTPILTVFDQKTGSLTANTAFITGEQFSSFVKQLRDTLLQTFQTTPVSATEMTNMIQSLTVQDMQQMGQLSEKQLIETLSSKYPQTFLFNKECMTVSQGVEKLVQTANQCVKEVYEKIQSALELKNNSKQEHRIIKKSDFVKSVAEAISEQEKTIEQKKRESYTEKGQILNLYDEIVALELYKQYKKIL